jgi:hypothetical protein
MRSINAQLARLEATHKKILRCLWCRYSLRDIPPSRLPEVKAQARERSGYIPLKCWSCGTPYVLSVKGLTPRQVEVVKLTRMTHPVKALADEKCHAAEIWLTLSTSRVKRYRRLKQIKREDALGRQRGLSPAQRSYQETTAEQRKAEREREALKSQALEFVRKQNDKWKMQAKAPESFPIDNTLEEIEERYHLANYGEPIKEHVRAAGLPVDTYSKTVDAFKVAMVSFYQFLSDLRKREACEVLLWGKAEPNTLEEIAFFEARLKHLPKITHRALQKEEEEKRRRDEERAEAERRRIEEIKARSTLTVQTEHPTLRQIKPIEPKPKPEPLPEFNENGRRRVEIPFIPDPNDPTRGLRLSQSEGISNEERSRSIHEHQRLIGGRGSFGG